MISKVRLPDTSKPAFQWHGVTGETASVFDPAAAAQREVKAYGGGANLPVCAKRGRASLDRADAARSRGVVAVSGIDRHAVSGNPGCEARAHPDR